MDKIYLDQYYEIASDYFSSQVTSPSADHFKLARQIKRTLNPHTLRRSLDIGCGSGRLVSAFAQTGFQASGIEPSAKAVSWASSIGLDVRQATLSDMPTCAYEVLTALHVLEHLQSPSAFVKDCARILCNGGLLILEVPNYRSRSAIRLREHWRPLYPDTHLYQFVPETLRRMTEQAGLRIVSELWLGGGTSWAQLRDVSLPSTMHVAQPIPRRGLVRQMTSGLWNMRRILFKIPGAQVALRYIYWHSLGFGEYLRIVAKKP